MHYLDELKIRLNEVVDPVNIPIQGGVFTMIPIKFNGDVIGVEVTNLGNGRGNNFLPLTVFAAVLSLLNLSQEYTAIKGMGVGEGVFLGSDQLPLNSVEAHVAQVVYGQRVGETLNIRRITPIAHILAWAGICENGRGYLKLIP